MASEENDNVFDQGLDSSPSSSQSLDDDDEEEELEEEEDEEEEEEDEDLHSTFPPLAVPSTSSSAAVTIAAVSVAPDGADAPHLPDAVVIKPDPSPALKRSCLPAAPDMTQTAAVAVAATPMTTMIVQQAEKKPLLDESRRLFQRLWTDEDEIELLQGFLDYTTQHRGAGGGGGGSHHDTAAFYDQIKSKLQLDFNKNQLVEKLRRLKKKYRNVLGKISSGKDFSFKSPHDQATFDISCKIWSDTGKISAEDGNLDEDERNPNPNPNFVNNGEVNVNGQKSTPRSRKRVRSHAKIEDSAYAANNSEIVNVGSSSANVSVSSLVEETVRSCFSPLLKELLSNVTAAGVCGGGGRGIGGLAMNAMPLSFGGCEIMVDEKWRKQQMLELEVYSKRLELVQDQIRARLEELRSMGGGSRGGG